jgi:WD40-like Beta Propeller Repeat
MEELAVAAYRRVTYRVLFLLGAVAVIVTAIACRGREEPLPTLDGPEAEDQVSRVSGYIVMDRPVGGMVALSLPDRKEVVLRPEGTGQGTVHSVGGPDDEGRIVYVENHTKFIRLKAMRIPGIDDTVIFERPGDALWQHVIGSPALAPKGGLVAFVWNATPGYAPDITGPLEIWDLTTKRGRKTDATAADEGLVWFPDGRRLAFVELLREREAQLITPGSPEYAVDYRIKGGTPVISMLDLTDGARTRVHVGIEPLVSPDGTAILMKDAAGRWWSLDLASGRAKRASWPGDWRGPIAWIADDLLLYWGLPTRGSPIRHTEFGSPLVRRHSMGDLKLCVLGTGRFQTVIQGIDPRRRLSFGTQTR